MTVSRAGFLKLCGMAFVGAGVDAPLLHGLSLDAAPADAPLPRAARAASLVDASAALFSPHVQSSFRLRGGGGVAALTLVEVAERPVSRGVEQFSLIFHAAPGHMLAGGIHSLQHDALGAFELFIAPVGIPDGRRTRYQACFSRHPGAQHAASRRT